MVVAKRLFLCLVLVAAACGGGDVEPRTQVGEPETSTASSTLAPTTSSSAATTSSTSPETTTTTTTLVPIEGVEGGLYCRDLAALGYGYSDAVAYWTREGAPDRMDADRNGIPCETVYDSDAVVSFWGDPLPTTTVDLWYAVGTPEYQVAPLPGSGAFYGSGCSPGSGPLPDGIWFGTIEMAGVETVEFDLMCFGPGPEGPGDVSNSSDRLRSVPVAGGAIIYTIDLSAGIGWNSRTYWGWVTDDGAACPEDCPVWLYVNEGFVTEVVQLFFA